MDDILTTAAAAPIMTAAAITGLVTAIGSAAPGIPRRAYPLLAIALGIAWSAAEAAVAGTLGPRVVIEGVIAGLTASGLYSAALRPAMSRLHLRRREPAADDGRPTADDRSYA